MYDKCVKIVSIDFLSLRLTRAIQLVGSHVGFTSVGCRYVKRQPLVELFYDIYYSCAVYTDELEFEEFKNNDNNSELLEY